MLGWLLPELPCHAYCTSPQQLDNSQPFTCAQLLLDLLWCVWACSPLHAHETEHTVWNMCTHWCTCLLSHTGDLQRQPFQRRAAQQPAAAAFAQLCCGALLGVCMCVHVCASVCSCTWMRLCACMHVCVCARVRVCVHVKPIQDSTRDCQGGLSGGAMLQRVRGRLKRTPAQLSACKYTWGWPQV